MKQLLIELKEDETLDAQLAELKSDYEAGDYSTLLFHIYAGIPDRERLVNIAQKLEFLFPHSKLAGTLSGGEIREGRMLDRSILISAMLFRQTDIQVFRFDNVKGREEQAGQEIRHALNSIPAVKGAELLLPGTELDTERLFEQISLCKPEIQIFGGYAGGADLSCVDHFVFDATGPMDNSVLAVTYAGSDFHIDVDKTVGWDTVGRPFRVTRAVGNHLMELDRQPAADIYERFLQIHRSDPDNAAQAFEFPLLARQNGDEMLRAVAGIAPDGTIDLFGYIQEGMQMQLSYGNPSTIVEKVNQRLERLNAFRPEAILLYSCLVRKTFWESFVDMEMLPFAAICPASGFHSWGEISRSLATGVIAENNITLLSVGMREGNGNAALSAAPRVDDTMLRGQVSILNRLSKLVTATTDELQKAYDNLSIMNQRLADMAEHDELTRLYNRRKIEQLINSAMSESGQTQQKLSLVMADVDLFKDINDTFGHEVGDIVLRKLSALLETSVAGIDGAAAGRWGGEEFFLLLPGLDEAAALDFAERLRVRVAEYPFPHVRQLTVSLGLITIQGIQNRRTVYANVDHALYCAKHAGRNRVAQYADGESTLPLSV